MKIETISLSDRVYLRALIEPSYSKAPKPAMIIVPGGSFLYKSRREADPVALRFLTLNYQCFILEYTTLWEQNYLRDGLPILNNELSPFPSQVLELFEAIAWVREHAQSLEVDPHRVFVTGFSAGGHIAASAAAHYRSEAFCQAVNKTPEQIRPDGLVLCYPFLNGQMLRFLDQAPNQEMRLCAPFILQSVFGKAEVDEEMLAQFDLMDKVHKHFPPVFVWHTSTDQTTYARDTALFVKELLDHGIPCEFHLFSSGRHGMALATPFVAAFEGDVADPNALWPVLADLFLKNQNH